MRRAERSRDSDVIQSVGIIYLTTDTECGFTYLKALSFLQGTS